MNRIFLILFFVGFTFGCSNKTQFNDNDIDLYLDFDSARLTGKYVYQGAKIHYIKGMLGKALDMRKTGNVSLKEVDSTWLSNDKDFSVSVWVNSNKISHDTTIVLSNADFNRKKMGIYGFRNINKGITLYSYKGGWAWNIGNGRAHYLYNPSPEKEPISDGQWHHLAFTYSHQKNEVKLYYDGVNKAILGIGDLKNINFKSEFPLHLGTSEVAKNDYPVFPGGIDELKIWKSTISAAEIEEEYKKWSGNSIKTNEISHTSFKILNWNIWHGGTHYTLEKDGFDGIERTIEFIKESGADLVLMQETYGAGPKISSALGFHYYEASSTIGAVWGANLSVMSRFPIEATYLLEEKSNYGKNFAFNNAGVKVKLNDNQQIIAFTNWYNNKRPDDLERNLKAWETLLNQADSIPVIYGGDYNSISHLDDGEGASGHSRLMTDHHFTDALRALYPDAESHPGYSFSDTKRRIDYIYFKGNPLELVGFRPIVPNFKGKGNKTPGYPSDHLGLIAEFKFKQN